MRKIIQIVFKPWCGSLENISESHNPVQTYALCDDGSVWLLIEEDCPENPESWAPVFNSSVVQDLTQEELDKIDA